MEWYSAHHNTMGNMKTLEQLKKEDKGFQGKHQVYMLYDCIWWVIRDKRANIPCSTLEEIGCKTLNFKVAFEGQVSCIGQKPWPTPF
jgi:hypothetical protein